MEKSVLAAAIDFSDDYSQMSWFDGFMREPESFSTIYNEKRYLIPSIIWFDDSSSRVCIGDEAVRCGKTGKGTLVKDMISAMKSESDFSVNGSPVKPADVIERYIVGLLNIFKNSGEKRIPGYIVVTVEDLTLDMITLLYDILNRQGYNNGQISVISHTESFLYYGLSREKELFANDVVMFDYNRNYFKYRRFSIEKNRHPQIINTVEKDFSDDFPYEYMKSAEGKKKADEILAGFVRDEFRAHVVSAAYLTGTGFYEDFMVKSLNFICSRRRVFKGYNLYVKGACYRAMEKAGYVHYKDMLFKCSARTRADVKLIVNDGGSDREIVLSKAGTNWYEAGAMADCITDGDTKVGFVIESPISGRIEGVTLDIGEFPKRPQKTTRIGISVAYTDGESCILKVEDKGFGEFYRSSGRSVSRLVDMSSY